MGYISTATISGKSRADGTTDRSITMLRVANVVGGFVLRESGVAPELAQKCTYRSDETKSSKGLIIRNTQSLWEWPYELASAPGIVAGVVQLNRTGLHVPSNCPANVRMDVKTQMTNMASASAGTVGLALVVDPIINGNYAF